MTTREIDLLNHPVALTTVFETGLFAWMATWLMKFEASFVTLDELMSSITWMTL
jgi:hypothetical protein